MSSKNEEVLKKTFWITLSICMKFVHLNIDDDIMADISVNLFQKEYREHKNFKMILNLMLLRC